MHIFNIQILILFCFLLISCETTPREKTDTQRKGATMTQEQIDLLQEGDIILRKGFGLASKYIIDILDEERIISHCGVVVKNEDGIGVLHCSSESLQGIDGVQTQSLKSFVHDSHEGSIHVVRLKGTTEQIQGMVSRCKYYEKEGRPFDYAFNHRDSSMFYCTELIDHSIQYSFGENRLPEIKKAGSQELMTLQQFFNPKYFSIIIGK